MLHDILRSESEVPKSTPGSTVKTNTGSGSVLKLTHYPNTVG
jgi:hypothetical protein